jgi:YfiH family protein
MSNHTGLETEKKGNCTIQNHGPLTRFFLPDFPLWHGFFARTGGLSDFPYASLSTAYVTKDPDAPANRSLLFQSIGMNGQPVRILNPCHGDQIAFVDKPEPKSEHVLIKTDAGFTRSPDTYFLVSTADCIPAVFTDDLLSFAGVIHLGWRNLLSNFTGKVIDSLHHHYQISPDALKVAIGPLIYPCCYVFKDPVQKDDPFWRPFLRYQEDGYCAIDLASAFKTQLTDCGIPAENILEAGLCTGCHNRLFFSCYKEGYISGRFPTLAGLNPA